LLLNRKNLSKSHHSSADGLYRIRKNFRKSFSKPWAYQNALRIVSAFFGYRTGFVDKENADSIYKPSAEELGVWRHFWIKWLGTNFRVENDWIQRYGPKKGEVFFDVECADIVLQPM
jgi:hypothetical protein